MLLMYECARKTLVRPRERLRFMFDDVGDMLNFGFGYMESQDHVVSSVLASPAMMKRILAEPDAVLEPTETQLGRIRTALLLVTPKLSDNQVVFANADACIDVNVDPNGTEEADADV